MSHFELNILTPSQVLALKMPCEEILFPSTVGRVNILPQHTHLLSQIDFGELLVFTEGKSTKQRFFLEGGVCKVLGSQISILTNQCILIENLDKEKISKELSDCKDKLADNSFSKKEFMLYHRRVLINEEKIRLQKQNV